MTEINLMRSWRNQNVVQEAIDHDGSSAVFHGINNADDLAWLGIHDLHDAYRWYNDHVRRVPHNAIRVIRVAQSVWPHTVNTTTWTYKAVNAKTGRMKLLPKLRKCPVGTNQYAKFLRDKAAQR